MCGETSFLIRRWPLTRWRGHGALWGLSPRALISLTRAPRSRPHHSTPQPRPPDTIPLGVSISTYELGGGDRIRPTADGHKPREMTWSWGAAGRDGVRWAGSQLAPAQPAPTPSPTGNTLIAPQGPAEVPGLTVSREPLPEARFSLWSSAAPWDLVSGNRRTRRTSHLCAPLPPQGKHTRCWTVGLRQGNHSPTSQREGAGPRTHERAGRALGKPRGAGRLWGTPFSVTPGDILRTFCHFALRSHLR